MSELNLKQVAEQLDEIAQAFIALGGTFRTAAGGSKSAGSNGKAGSKPATAGGKGKAKPVEDEDAGSDIDSDSLKAALKELAEAKGKDKVAEALQEVGAGKLSDVDESQYQELMDKINELKEAEDEAEEEAPKKPARKTAAKGKKKAGPTMDELKEKFTELVDADKAKAKAVLKELGVAKLAEVDEDSYQEAMDAIEAAMADEDDDLVG